jgi:hypothetical protein
MTKLIIWDEAAMQHRNAAEAVDRSCRDIRNKYNTPFGGITVVFGGDFLQTLPVIPKGLYMVHVVLTTLLTALTLNAV